MNDAIELQNLIVLFKIVFSVHLVCKEELNLVIKVSDF